MLRRRSCDQSRRYGLLVDEQVDRFRFMKENEKVMNRDGEPADGTPLLPGLTDCSFLGKNLARGMRG